MKHRRPTHSRVNTPVMYSEADVRRFLADERKRVTEELGAALQVLLPERDQEIAKQIGQQYAQAGADVAVAKIAEQWNAQLPIRDQAVADAVALRLSGREHMEVKLPKGA
jgi:hypothetical protein